MADRVQTDARAARLAAALRTNLVRRKQRDRAAPTELPTEANASAASVGTTEAPSVPD